MTYTTSSPGWFDTVNGHKVIAHPLPDNVTREATTWADTGPHGIVWHYQAGCGSDLFDLQLTKNNPPFPFINFNIDQSGTIRQYMDTRKASWHCFDASRYFLGVEHAILPGTCDVNSAMLETSAAMFAALIEWVKDTYNITIPLIKVGPVTPANYKTIDGIFGHVDIEPGSVLNPNRHSDTLQGESWSQFLTNVETLLKGSDMTPEQEAQLAEALEKSREADDFRAGINDRRNGKPIPTDDGPRKNGWKFADEAFSRPASGGGNVPTKPFDATITPK